ncbi:MAG: cytochrome c biogenesis protein ResB, partial [Planctomycetes bacterium]|nr:cytochrome c biogenesis protein ResB [Planctomycetota bacterium]
YDRWELAVVDVAGDPTNNEWYVGNDLLHTLTGDAVCVLSGEGLPFDVHAHDFVPNGRVMQKGPMWNTDYPVIDGYAVMEQPLAGEGGANAAALFVNVVPKGAAVGSQGTQGILYARSNLPMVVQWEGRPYTIDIRNERYALPFVVEQVKFTKEEHPRTRIASKFASDVLRIEGDSKTPVHISMNEPLRENGLVMFQSGWGPQNARPGSPLFSTFAVVKNPSDKWPEYSCWVIAAGMLIAFGQRLTAYLQRQSKQRTQVEAEEAA